MSAKTKRFQLTDSRTFNVIEGLKLIYSETYRGWKAFYFDGVIDVIWIAGNDSNEKCGFAFSLEDAKNEVRRVLR